MVTSGASESSFGIYRHRRRRAVPLIHPVGERKYEVRAAWHLVAAADGVFGDAVGTRLAVLATLDASGVVARLVLHGAVLRFRVHRDRLATSYRLVLDFRPLCDNLLAALDAARSAMRPAASEFVVVRANARIWAARSRPGRLAPARPTFPGRLFPERNLPVQEWPDRSAFFRS